MELGHLKDMSPTNFVVSPINSTKNSLINNYSSKFSHFMRSEDKPDKEMRKRHSTQEKGLTKLALNETKPTNSGNMFYSPKGNASNF